MPAKTQTIKANIDLGDGLTLLKAKVSLYGIGIEKAKKLDSIEIVKSRFSIEIKNPNHAYYYLVVEAQEFVYHGEKRKVGERVVQFCTLLSADDLNVTINERSTIATLFCFARFIDINNKGEIQITASDKTLSVAYGMRNNFCGPNGDLSDVIKSSPNGLETNSFPLFNFLSNLLYYSLVDEAVYHELLKLSGGKKKLHAALQAMHHLSIRPFTEVQAIYELVSHKDQVYQPSLPGLTLPKGHSRVPTQWLLSIKVNHSGANNFLIGGPAFVVFDKDDKAWIANNVRQGTPNSGTFVVVLNADGSPSELSPLFGGGVLGPGFGIAINHKKDTVYVGNYGWGPTQCNPQEGSISVFSSDGDILSPKNGYTDKLSRVQGLDFDRKGNLWMASWGTQSPLAPSDANYYAFKDGHSAVVMYPDGKPENAVSYVFDSPYHETFGICIDHNDDVIVTNSGNKGQGIPASVYKFRLVKGNIQKLAQWDVTVDSENATNDGFEAFRQASVNSKNEIYVGAVGTNRVIKFTPDLKYIRDFTLNISAPWGVNIDSNDVIYAGNFGKEYRVLDQAQTSMGVGPLGITVIDEKAKTNHMIKLPTGGHEVMLANGFPLYGMAMVPGSDEPRLLPCYQPLMRLTSTNIDRAGNLWALNNWKPSAYIDLEENPGGDGAVIFVGAAEPGGEEL